MTPEQFKDIVAAIAAGEPAYKAVTANHVSTRTFWAELASSPEAEKEYARAKLLGMERLADECIEIADDGTNDTITDEDGNERPNTEWITRSRLRVDTRKWLLSKLVPKRYGDKMETTLAGDPSRPLVHEVVQRTIVDPRNTDA